MVQQELGWPDSTNENKDDSNDNEDNEDNEDNDNDNRLEPGQLVRAMLRPGGHFYNGRITHSNEDGSMCGVEFFDGDKVDALPRNLITVLVSPKKKVVPAPSPLSPPTTTSNSDTNGTDKETEPPPANGASSVPSIAATAAATTTAAATIVTVIGHATGGR